ncbi:polymorphic toxin type 50 domain-containing protein [Entomobacter blattae]|uniref:Bacterial toxin 50 n=1 Tax=Entomobacter blattae TaxID=2762277 RepID=A0A7H1NNN2_9PROT|nr:polymorphic toxin type 50 domain-containing protein [Entomobacter blattae]QNT77392.1 Bacterial toxin 50 [Entomobacter blattae]
MLTPQNNLLATALSQEAGLKPEESQALANFIGNSLAASAGAAGGLAGGGNLTTSVLTGAGSAGNIYQYNQLADIGTAKGVAAALSGAGVGYTVVEGGLLLVPGLGVAIAIGAATGAVIYYVNTESGQKNLQQAVDIVSSVFQGSVKTTPIAVQASNNDGGNAPKDGQASTSAKPPVSESASLPPNEPDEDGDKNSNISKNIDEGRQGKHVPGHNNNINPNKSDLLKEIDPQELLDGVHSGKYTIKGYDQRNGNPIVDFGKPIGEVKGKITNLGKIHSGKNGAHIVPHVP